jgi:hypothetical protein
MGSIVSAITGTSGGSGGAQGINYTPPPINVPSPVTQDQLNQGYNSSYDALNQLTGLSWALQNNNGLQNQQDVYGRLQGVANGTGPNPAQAQLAQATGANTANQAALMASQRGTGQNAGMIARQAAMQGGANQQAAAGQAATLQAQQSLGAIGQMGSMAQNQVSQQLQSSAAFNQAAQNEQSTLLNAQTANNATKAGLQANINSANAGLAGIVANGQMQMVGNIMQGAGAAMGLAKGGMIPHFDEGGSIPGALGVNTNLSSNMSSAPPATQAATTSQASPTKPKSKVGQFFNPSSSDSQQPQQSGSAAAGQVMGKALGTGIKAGYNALFSSSSPKADQSQDGTVNGLTSVDADTAMPTASSQLPANNMPTPEASDALDSDVMMAAKGGKVPAMVSPGEKYLAPKDVKKVEKGANPMEVGKKVPGKPVVAGNKNSYANDIVPATLEEGGIVLPRSVTQAKDPAKEAHKFVSAIMAKQGKHLPKKSK